MKERIISVLLIFVFILSLVSCEDELAPSEETHPVETTVQVDAEQTTVPVETNPTETTGEETTKAPEEDPEETTEEVTEPEETTPEETTRAEEKTPETTGGEKKQPKIALRTPGEDEKFEGRGQLYSAVSEKIYLVIDWTVTDNRDGTADLNVYAGLSCYSFFTGEKKNSGKITVNGETYTFSTAEIGHSENKLTYVPLGQHTFKIEKGQKTVNISASWAMQGQYAGMQIASLSASGRIDVSGFIGEPSEETDPADETTEAETTEPDTSEEETTGEETTGEETTDEVTTEAETTAEETTAEETAGTEA